MAETLQLFIDDDGKVYKVDPDTGAHNPLPQATATKLSGQPQFPSQGGAPPIGAADMLQRGASLAGFGTIATVIARFAAVAGLIEEVRKRIEKNIDAQKKLNEARAREIAEQQEAQRTKKERIAKGVKERIQERINNAPIDAYVDISPREDNAIRRDLKDKYNKKAARKDRKKKSSTASAAPAKPQSFIQRATSSVKSFFGKGGSSTAGAAANGAKAASTAASAAEGAGVAAGAEGLLALAGPVGMVAAAAAAAGAALYGFKKAVDGTVAQLAQFAPQTSVAMARGQIRGMIQDVKHAQALDSDMARFVEIQNELTLIVKQIYRAIIKTGLENVLPVLEAMMQFIKKAYNDTVDSVSDLPKLLGPIKWEFAKMMLPLLQVFQKIAANIKALGDKDPVGIDPFIDDFFNMVNPNHPPNQKNQASGAFAPGGFGGPPPRLMKP